MHVWNNLEEFSAKPTVIKLFTLPEKQIKTGPNLLAVSPRLDYLVLTVDFLDEVIRKTAEKSLYDQLFFRLVKKTDQKHDISFPQNWKKKVVVYNIRRKTA